MKNGIPLLARFALLLSLVWCAAPAAAHLTPNSEVRLDVQADTIVADIIVPKGEYAYGTGNPVDGSPASLRIARDYLASGFTVTGADGQKWTVDIGAAEFIQIEGPPDLHAVAVLTPPPGGSVSDFVIDWRVLVKTLPSHFAMFVHGGQSGQGQRGIIGVVRNNSPPLAVSLQEEGAFIAFSSAVQLGAHHIIEGYDHLLFLLALLLPAPLLVQGHRWAGRRPSRQAMGKLGWIVTAFTIGHSITLIAATLVRMNLPAAPVEIAIAISVLASAIHALRPVIPNREPLVALLFGLIHGLAFATLVQQAGGGVANRVASMLGFNLGIELVQLAIVAAVAPCLLLLARYSLYRALRIALAGACAAASVVWIINRSFGIGDPVVLAMESAMARSWLLIAGLLILSAVLLALRHWPGRSDNRFAGGFGAGRAEI